MTEETPVFHRIISLLDGEGVPYERFSHEHVHRSEDAAKVRGTSLAEAAKALVLKAGSGALLMCVVPGHRRIDMKALKALLGERNVALAHPDEVLAATGCPVGTVPPFGNFWGLPVYADADIATREHVVFSAGSHYRSVRMRAGDWQRLTGAQFAGIGKEA
jgi:Ala-tRNA(Pro) deacylase